MANEQNLIRNEDLTPRERRENASKAGKASAKKRKQNKTFAELCNQFANNIITDTELKERMAKLGIADEEMTNKMALVISLWNKALDGDVRAIEAYRDTVGEKPVDKLQLEQDKPFEVNITVKNGKK